MSTNPEFDLDNLPALPPGKDDTTKPESRAVDPPGSSENEREPVSENAARAWDGPSLPVDSVLRAIATGEYDPLSLGGGQVAKTEPAPPAMDWAQLAAAIGKMSSVLDQKTVKEAPKRAVENLAGENAPTVEEPSLVDPLPIEFLNQIRSLADSELQENADATEVLAPSILSSAEPRVTSGADANEPQTTHLNAEDSAADGRAPESSSNLELLQEKVEQSLEESEFQLVPFALEQPALDAPDTGRPLFASFYKTKPKIEHITRIPNFGHLSILVALAFLGLLGSSLLTRSALYFNLWGISTVQSAATDVHYTIGSMAAMYFITFGAALLIFPVLWRQSFFSGIQWNASAAARSFWPLLGAASVCFVLAMVDEILLPGPTDAPIDKLFNTQSSAWLLFAFGVTFAPFFEEIIFRGFLLPSLSTAFDWILEKATGSAPDLHQDGHPRWSVPAMVFGSITTSVPFALMHAEQTGYSLGPFLLLVAVSLVLCWARLWMRSLAASVIVHASYNFLLFSLMLLGTSGFKHLDKL